MKKILLFLFLAGLWSLPLAAADKSADELKAAAAPVETSKGVLFSFEKQDAGTVSVAGTMNNWDSKKNMMKKNKNGIWTGVVAIPAGKIEYKFVINDKDWVDDPKNPDKIEDSYGGGKKSIFEVKKGVDLGGVSVKDGKATFRFYAPSARSVSAAGSFNSWKGDANPMVKDDSGVWSVQIDLKPGTYQYKYVVDGKDWVVDPSNKDAADDGYGGSNSVVKVESAK
jgi:1,4-alpha-glucan branching enzyme